MITLLVRVPYSIRLTTLTLNIYLILQFTASLHCCILSVLQGIVLLIIKRILQ